MANSSSLRVTSPSRAKVARRVSTSSSAGSGEREYYLLIFLTDDLKARDGSKLRKLSLPLRKRILSSLRPSKPPRFSLAATSCAQRGSLKTAPQTLADLQAGMAALVLTTVPICCRRLLV